MKMTDKFSLKEICGEYKFFEEGDSFPLTEKQIVNKLNENEELKKENKKHKKENEQLKYHLNGTEKELQEYKDFMSLG